MTTKIHPIFMPWIFFAITSADILKNPDFELPPSNWTANSRTPFPMDDNSTIPGWTFRGIGQYVNSSIRGHAIQLSEDGQINQTFRATAGDPMHYILTFALSREVQTCSTNASLVVSAPDSSAEFSLSGKYGKEPWEVYGHRIGSWGDGELINLVIQSQDVDSDSNSTCWPVVDDLTLITVGSVNQDKGNLLENGGFESGPAFLESYNKGVILDSEPSLVESVLQTWAVSGTVKYINAKNYFVPEGKAAVQFLGVSAGVQTAKQLTKGSDYTLQFMLGDANDSCSGDFVVGAAAGSSAQNFTVRSNGTGMAKKYSLTFTGDGPGITTISFQSYTVGQKGDGVVCGPILDAVFMSESSGRKPSTGIAFVGLFFVALIIRGGLM